VDLFGIAFSIIPTGVISGLSIAKTKHYRPQLWLSWALILIGLGLLSTNKVNTSRGFPIGFQVIVGAGAGILMTSTYFPVLAPLPVSENAQAISLFMFCRNFGQVGGTDACNSGGTDVYGRCGVSPSAGPCFKMNYA
jgi:hypothetical protein